MSQQPNLSVGVIDEDSGFVSVLDARLAAQGWSAVRLSGGESPDNLIALKLNALVVDPAAVGGRFWGYVTDICDALPGLPLVVCSTDSSVEERVKGLRLGADDWIRKPCHAEEVVARIGAVVRRKQRSPGRLESRPVRAGPLEILPDRYEARLDDESLNLTRREFEVLHVLAVADGQVIERDEIYLRVWGYAMAHGDRSVDVFVRKLRQKFEARSNWGFIHTHHGVGYRFDAVKPPSGSQPVHKLATAA